MPFRCLPTSSLGPTVQVPLHFARAHVILSIRPSSSGERFHSRPYRCLNGDNESSRIELNVRLPSDLVGMTVTMIVAAELCLLRAAIQPEAWPLWRETESGR